MCLVTLAIGVHADYPLILAGNRDELHARPAAAADWWQDAESVLGGRDQRAGGSWLAVSSAGRFAVITNQPEKPPPAGAASRGELVSGFVAGVARPVAYADAVAARRRDYAGFRLLVGDLRQACLVQEPGAPGTTPRRLEPGITTLTNAPVNVEWPKAAELSRQLQDLLQQPFDADDILALLQRDTPLQQAAGGGLPDAAYTPFVRGATYGTRASTVCLIHRSGQACFVERRFGSGGAAAGESRFKFALTTSAS